MKPKKIYYMKTFNTNNKDWCAMKFYVFTHITLEYFNFKGR